MKDDLNIVQLDWLSRISGKYITDRRLTHAQFVVLVAVAKEASKNYNESFNMTHRRMSSIYGVSRGTISTALRKLVDLEILSKNNREYRVI